MIEVKERPIVYIDNFNMTSWMIKKAALVIEDTDFQITVEAEEGSDIIEVGIEIGVKKWGIHLPTLGKDAIQMGFENFCTKIVHDMHEQALAEWEKFLEDNDTFYMIFKDVDVRLKRRMLQVVLSQCLGVEVNDIVIKSVKQPYCFEDQKWLVDFMNLKDDLDLRQISFDGNAAVKVENQIKAQCSSNKEENRV